jgi:hypothetical protein
MAPYAQEGRTPSWLREPRSRAERRRRPARSRRLQSYRAHPSTAREGLTTRAGRPAGGRRMHGGRVDPRKGDVSASANDKATIRMPAKDRTRKFPSSVNASSLSSALASRSRPEPLPSSPSAKRGVASFGARCGTPDGDNRRPAATPAGLPSALSTGELEDMAAAASRLCASFWTLSARLIRTSVKLGVG